MTLLIAALFTAALPFPPEIVTFDATGGKPLFQAGPAGAWDARIRERGWILREDDGYHFWYTGYASSDGIRQLGYATSPDGYTWTRYAGNPLCAGQWIEDLCVVKDGETYYMFAEGEHDHAHLLTSTDKLHWTEQGTLDIRKADGTPIDPGPFGTPAVLHEDGTWYLYYERDDLALWLATSKDLKTWTNVQDEPVLKRGPEPYDVTMIAANQVLHYQDHYYLYYHALCPENGRDRWTTNVAASADRIHWEKFPGNPILPPNHSSGYLVHDGTQYRLYTAHPDLRLFLPKAQ